MHLEVERWQACALTTADEVWCWGNNVTSTPVRLATESFEVAHVTIGESWIWVLEENGRVRSHLLSSDFEMAQSRDHPPFVALEATPGLVCGTTADGELWCGGSQQLPDFAPVPMTNIRLRYLSGYYNCTVDSESVTRCWVRDEPPVMVAVPPLRRLSAHNGACGISRNGASYCWRRGSEELPSLVTLADS